MLLLHSKSESTGLEAFSFQVEYPYAIHQEMMTHRWSRNYSSSRAIPFAKKCKRVVNDPAMQPSYGKNQPGMAMSDEEVDDVETLKEEIKKRGKDTVEWLQGIEERYNPHKEILNRFLYPWDWISGIITTGKWQLHNFFNLRIHKAASPAIRNVAIEMAKAVRYSEPQILKSGHWHIPYLREQDYNLEVADRLIWSVARCAWVSYDAPDKEATFDRAKIRHDDAIVRLHVSTMEHQLQATDKIKNGQIIPGFDNYRSMIPREFQKEFDYSILDQF